MSAHLSTPTTTHLAPTPPGTSPLRGLWRALTGDRLSQFVELQRLYGDIVRFNVGGMWIHLIADPAMIKTILLDNNKNYMKGMGLQRAKIVVGEGLLTSEGEFWRRQRRLAQPAFHRQHLAVFAEVMASSAARLAQAWEARAGTGVSFDVSAEMMRLTLDIVTRTLFTTALDSADAQTIANAFPPLLKAFEYRVALPFDWIEELPLPIVRRYKAHIADLDRVVNGIIAQRRRSGVNHPDLLGMFMQARDEESGEQMSDKHLRDEVLTILLAGHETTANTLSWTWYLLAQHPVVVRKLQAEVDGVLAGRLPTADDLPQLVYTRQIVDESLRLYPPAWIVARQPLADDEVGGYHIPADSTVIMSPYLVQRHPAYWDDPAAFRPERFAAGWDRDRPRFVYFPFGGGPRLCIGNNFALMEATLILATLAQRYRLTLDPVHAVIPQPALVLRPKNGVYMTLHHR